MGVARVGCEYKPDWINSVGMILDISKRGAVKVLFVEGEIRWFRPSYFREHFTHYDCCIHCGDADFEYDD